MYINIMFVDQKVTNDQFRSPHFVRRTVYSFLAGAGLGIALIFFLGTVAFGLGATFSFFGAASFFGADVFLMADFFLGAAASFFVGTVFFLGADVFFVGDTAFFLRVTFSFLGTTFFASAETLYDALTCTKTPVSTPRFRAAFKMCFLGTSCSSRSAWEKL
jgi:hypothetical protein